LLDDLHLDQLLLLHLGIHPLVVLFCPGPLCDEVAGADHAVGGEGEVALKVPVAHLLLGRTVQHGRLGSGAHGAAQHAMAELVYADAKLDAQTKSDLSVRKVWKKCGLG
jgi:hypothetical protein